MWEHPENIWKHPSNIWNPLIFTRFQRSYVPKCWIGWLSQTRPIPRSPDGDNKNDDNYDKDNKIKTIIAVTPTNRNTDWHHHINDYHCHLQELPLSVRNVVFQVDIFPKRFHVQLQQNAASHRYHVKLFQLKANSLTSGLLSGHILWGVRRRHQLALIL